MFKLTWVGFSAIRGRFQLKHPSILPSLAHTVFSLSNSLSHTKDETIPDSGCGFFDDDCVITLYPHLSGAAFLQDLEVKWSVSRSVVPDSLWPQGLQPTRLFCPWNFPGKNTGVGSHFFLWGIFPTQESNPGLLHCRQILYWLSYEGSLQDLSQDHINFLSSTVDNTKEKIEHLGSISNGNIIFKIKKISKSCTIADMNFGTFALFLLMLNYPLGDHREPLQVASCILLIQPHSLWHLPYSSVPVLELLFLGSPGSFQWRMLFRD